MQRYFVNPEQIQNQKVVITGADAHHITTVMRSKLGDEILICNGKGQVYTAKLDQLGKGEVDAVIVDERLSDEEAKPEVRIFQSLPKGDKMDFIIQKGTELGAASFVPFQSARTIVQYDSKKELKRLERWNKIAKEAAEQAHRAMIPTVHRPVSWQTMLQEAAVADAAFFCYEKSGGLGLKQLLRKLQTEQPDANKRKLAVIIGPEGGFTEEEAQQAKEAGCSWITLGRRILRTETASLAALACIMYEFDEMGGN